MQQAAALLMQHNMLPPLVLSCLSISPPQFLHIPSLHFAAKAVIYALRAQNCTLCSPCLLTLPFAFCTSPLCYTLPLFASAFTRLFPSTPAHIAHGKAKSTYASHTLTPCPKSNFRYKFHRTFASPYLRKRLRKRRQCRAKYHFVTAKITQDLALFCISKKSFFCTFAPLLKKLG